MMLSLTCASLEAADWRCSESKSERTLTVNDDVLELSYTEKSPDGKNHITYLLSCQLVNEACLGSKTVVFNGKKTRSHLSLTNSTRSVLLLDDSQLVFEVRLASKHIIVGYHGSPDDRLECQK
jgi:hypothetical protein